MSKIFVILNTVLLLGSLLLSAALLRQDDSVTAAAVHAAEPASSQPQQAVPVKVKAPEPRPLAQLDTQPLGGRTLFRPERNETLLENAADTAAEQRQNLVLVSVMIIPPGSGMARIRVSDEAPGPRRPTSAGGTAGSRSSASRRPTPPPAPGAADNTRSYNIGDKIAGTEYMLKEIHFDHVVLERGDESRILKIDPEAEDSATRKAAAAAPARPANAPEAERVQVVMAPAETPAAAAANITSLPPPPPPPPMLPGGPVAVPPAVSANPVQKAGGSASSADELSREERRNRALEARRRLLEERRNQAQQQP